MRALLIGALGQVGRGLVERAASTGTKILALDRTQLDVTNEAAVREVVSRETPDVVINAAAYTAVDQAEEEAASAFAVNADAPHHLAAACAHADIPLIHLSTDYVFDGKINRPYREDDAASPLNIYGQSKWRGEEAVRQAQAHHLILRVSAVFSPHGNNFVKTMLRLAREGQPLRVVTDQTTGPTAASDIADVILLLVGRLAKEPSLAWGTYHYRGTPPTTWCDFARAILDVAHEHKLVTAATVTPIMTAEYQTRAQRPVNAVLDCGKITQAFAIRPRRWCDGLTTIIDKLLQ
jgi:dTDP-4-dehydrorhamnose reductase